MFFSDLVNIELKTWRFGDWRLRETFYTNVVFCCLLPLLGRLSLLGRSSKSTTTTITTWSELSSAVSSQMYRLNILFIPDMMRLALHI